MNSKYGRCDAIEPARAFESGIGNYGTSRKAIRLGRRPETLGLSHCDDAGCRCLFIQADETGVVDVGGRRRRRS